MKLAVTMALFLLISLQQSFPDPGPLETVQMGLGTKTYTLEVADTDAARTRGLMYRREMAEDHGMLFIFEQSRPLSFYMKNTYLPLDLIYLDEHGKVVSIHPLRPLDQTTVRSLGSAMYVVELNRGQAEAAGLKRGDTVKLPELAATP